MLTSRSDLLEKSKPSSRCLSREVSAINPSLEVYYGGASISVPFTWESQPGTPKVKFRENPLPPLTPPPTVHFSSTKKPTKRLSKSNLFHAVLPKLNLRRTSHPPSPASSLSSSSSWSPSCSVPSSPFTPSNIRGRVHLSSARSSFDSRVHEEDEYGSPVSALCFGTARGANGRSRGFSSNVIKVLLREFT
ncbi:uncharacterized protein LOC130774093 [Actinidia eriantha]|uniref:uncharacterized protein LOC130774093 n=1 Tax=Actinidia eriantha TaxID=165200 RepID=UPI0025906E22|nr:uncharacterized protein LOC130774093 [Actinidia eriantha]